MYGSKLLMSQFSLVTLSSTPPRLILLVASAVSGATHCVAWFGSRLLISVLACNRVIYFLLPMTYVWPFPSLFISKSRLYFMPPRYLGTDVFFLYI